MGNRGRSDGDTDGNTDGNTVGNIVGSNSEGASVGTPVGGRSTIEHSSASKGMQTSPSASMTKISVQLLLCPTELALPKLPSAIARVEVSPMTINPKSMVAVLETKQLSTTLALPLPVTVSTPNAASLSLKIVLSNDKRPPTFVTTANEAVFPSKKQSTNCTAMEETWSGITNPSFGSEGKSSLPP